MLNVNDAYAICYSVAKTHYENFPVALWLFPHHLRHAIAAIYAFARMSDDIVDEGDLTPTKRLALIQAIRAELRACVTGQASQHQAIFIALQDTIRVNQLPTEPFFNLLEAFEQDITQQTYANKTKRLYYCQRSANPIGQLVLALFGRASEENIQYSNAICTALQLINFLQDIDSDWQLRQRIYIPLELLALHKVPQDEFLDKKHTVAMQAVMLAELQDIQQLLDYGQPLLRQLAGRSKWYIAIIISCAQYLVEALKKRGGNITQRPTINWRALPKLAPYLWRNLLSR